MGIPVNWSEVDTLWGMGVIVVGAVSSWVSRVIKSFRSKQEIANNLLVAKLDEQNKKMDAQSIIVKEGHTELSKGITSVAEQLRVQESVNHERHVSIIGRLAYTEAEVNMLKGHAGLPTTSQHRELYDRIVERDREAEEKIQKIEIEHRASNTDTDIN